MRRRASAWVLQPLIGALTWRDPFTSVAGFVAVCAICYALSAVTSDGGDPTFRSVTRADGSHTVTASISGGSGTWAVYWGSVASPWPSKILGTASESGVGPVPGQSYALDDWVGKYVVGTLVDVAANDAQDVLNYDTDEIYVSVDARDWHALVPITGPRHVNVNWAPQATTGHEVGKHIAWPVHYGRTGRVSDEGPNQKLRYVKSFSAARLRSDYQIHAEIVPPLGPFGEAQGGAGEITAAELERETRRHEYNHGNPAHSHHAIMVDLLETSWRNPITMSEPLCSFLYGSTHLVSDGGQTANFQVYVIDAQKEAWVDFQEGEGEAGEPLEINVEPPDNFLGDIDYWY